jgi:uncharacterized 2Fe-2S/4Fe-4S cluster protein (DUF4445 family)
MARHPVTFSPSGRTIVIDDGTSLLAVAEAAGEPIAAECAGRGACGRCLVRVLGGAVPEHRIEGHEAGTPLVLACQTPVHGPLTVQPLVGADLPRLAPADRHVGLELPSAFGPWPLALDPLVKADGPEDLGVAIDVGTTTVQLLLVHLASGRVVGEASAYNPQIPRGADVIARIVAAERGQLAELSGLIRSAIVTLIEEAARPSGADAAAVRAYVVAGNLTMIHLLLGVDPARIRRVPCEPAALAFEPCVADELGWPGRGAVVHTIPAVGGWVGGDIVAGLVRAGFSRAPEDEGLTLYVDLGTNGEVALGGRDFALACACSAGPAFEGGGIRCGMRADAGAIDGARLDVEQGVLELSVIGGGAARGVCGSGLITLADVLLRAGWIDRAGCLTERLPSRLHVEGRWGRGVSLAVEGDVTLWERDLASLVRAKGAILAGIRSLYGALGDGAGPVARVLVSGNFGRFLNLPAAIGIGLLPDLPPGRFGYIHNGSLEGAALALLSRAFLAEIEAYRARVTYVDLSELPGYMDELVGASFLPHTTPALLRLGDE